MRVAITMGKNNSGMHDDVLGYACHDASGHLSPYTFSRRHEIVGVVIEVGKNVKRFKVGDKAGVGCMSGSCGSCDACEKSMNQYCDNVMWTSNSKDVDGSITKGGFSTLMVVNEKFALRIPDNLPLAAAAPLLCAGITVYSPMKYYGMVKKGNHIGIVGLGGLGHMAIKFAKKFGLEVTVISTSPQKEKEAKEVLGADNFLVSKDPAQMEAATRSMDFIIDTVSATHPIHPLLNLLKVNGGLVLLGLPEKPLPLLTSSIASARRFVAGSKIGGIVETQEMLDFCGKNDLVATIEKIPMDYVNMAMERLLKADVKYRFVIDIQATLLPSSMA